METKENLTKIATEWFDSLEDQTVKAMISVLITIGFERGEKKSKKELITKIQDLYNKKDKDGFYYGMEPVLDDLVKSV